MNVSSKRKMIIIFSIIIIIIAIFLLVKNVVIPANQYKVADTLLSDGKYMEAIAAFEELGEYKDSPTRIKDAQYAKAEDLLESGNYGDALYIFEFLNGYKESALKIEECYEMQLQGVWSMSDTSNQLIMEFQFNNGKFKLSLSFMDELIDSTGGTYEIGDGIIRLKYNNGDTDKITYVEKDGELVLKNGFTKKD